MHNASDRLRYLYGLGGLGDAPHLRISPEIVRMTMTRPALTRMMQMSITASGDPDPTNPQQETEELAAECDCALAAAQQAFSLDPTVMGEMQIACRQNPSAFLVALQQQAAAQGVTLDTARCGANGAAWYKDPKKLALAGVAGAGALALIWMVMK